MAVSLNWGVLRRGLELLERGLGFMQGSFRVDATTPIHTPDLPVRTE